MNYRKLFLTVITFSLVSFGSAQNWSWGTNGGGNLQQLTKDIAADASGNQVVTGTYSRGPAVFGTYSLPWETYSTDPSNTNINTYIVKYNTSHTVSWAARITSYYDAEVSSVSMDNAGNIYVCGSFSDECHFFDVNGTSPHFTLFHTALSGNNAFLAKYTSAGVCVWAKTGLATAAECFSEVAVNPAGNLVIVTGRINTGVPITIGSSTISTGSYVLWFDNAGNKIRAYNYTNDATYTSDYKNGLCIDGQDNIIVGGKLTTSSYTVKGNSGNIAVSTNANGASLFAKYNGSNGNLAWAKATRGTAIGSNSMPSSIVVDGSNNVYVGGWIQRLASTSYTFQFPVGASYVNIPVVNTIQDHAYVAKLSGSNGDCSWATYYRGTESGTEDILLEKGTCDVIYASINTLNNPSFTDWTGTTFSFTNANKSAYVIKLNTAGQFISTTPWVASVLYGSRGYIAGNRTTSIYLASSFNSTISLQTSGSPISLTPNATDMLLAGFTDLGQQPDVNFNTITPVCLGAWLPVTVTATGMAPLTFTWSIYNNSTGTFVYMGTTGAPNCTIIPSVYMPYTFNFAGYTVIYLQVAVTNCSGVTDYAYTYVAFKLPVSFSQVTDQTVCYTATDPAPDAIFSVSAQWTNTYQWKYSPDLGANWFTCGAGYLNANSSSLTVQHPGSAMDNYEYFCIMTGDCSTDTSAPAILHVVNCAREINPENNNGLSSGPVDDGAIAVFPNPVADELNVSGISGDAQVMVMTIEGRVLLTTSCNSSTAKLNVGELARGVYLVRVKDANGVHTQRFICQ